MKKIHINIPDDVHQRLRVACAYEDTTIQEYVFKLIRDSVKAVPLRKPSKERG